MGAEHPSSQFVHDRPESHVEFLGDRDEAASLRIGVDEPRRFGGRPFSVIGEEHFFAFGLDGEAFRFSARGCLVGESEFGFEVRIWVGFARVPPCAEHRLDSLVELERELELQLRLRFESGCDGSLLHGDAAPFIQFPEEQVGVLGESRDPLLVARDPPVVQQPAVPVLDREEHFLRPGHVQLPLQLIAIRSRGLLPGLARYLDLRDHPVADAVRRREVAGVGADAEHRVVLD